MVNVDSSYCCCWFIFTLLSVMYTWTFRLCILYIDISV